MIINEIHQETVHTILEITVDSELFLIELSSWIVVGCSMKKIFDVTQKTFKLNYTTHIKMINDLEELLKRQHISILNMNYVQKVHYLSLCKHLKDS